MTVSYPAILRPFVCDLQLDNSIGAVVSKPDEQIVAETTKAKPESRWFVSPIFDLIFVCGLAPWILGYFTQFSTLILPDSQGLESTHDTFNMTLVVAALLIGESHQFTSIIRYVEQRFKKKWEPPFKTFVYLAVALHLLLAMFMFAQSSHVPFVSVIEGTISSLIAPLGMLLFPVVLMQHIAAQSKAIGLIYCARSGFQLSKKESILLSIVNICLVIFGAMTIAGPFGLFQEFANSMEMFSVLPYLCLVSSATIFGGLMVSRGRRTGQWLPAGAAILWSNMLAFVLLGKSTFATCVWLFIPIFFHATQHWSIAWMTTRKESQDLDEQPGFRDFLVFCRLVFPVIAVTLLVLFMPLLMFDMSKLQSAEKTLPLGWSMFVFYLHFFADRVVWRPEKKGGKKNVAIAAQLG